MESRSSHRKKDIIYSLGFFALIVSLPLGVLLSRYDRAGWKNSATGRLKVVMGRTPPPSHPVKEATVTVTRVEVLRSRRISERATFGASMNEVETFEPTEDAWITVYQGEQILNLLEIREGRGNLLINADIPEGHYTRLRLTCGQGRITIDNPQRNAADHTFIVRPQRPVAAEVALNCDFVVASGRETSLLLDVNVDLAFQPISYEENGDLSGASGFVFRPAQGMRVAKLVSASPSELTLPARTENR